MRTFRSSLPAASCLLGLQVISGCGPAGVPSRVKAIDAGLEQDFESEDSAEARTWLAGDTHYWFPGDGSKELIAQCVNQFCSAGASRVVISDIIEGEDGSQLSASIIVAVPSDEQARERVFRVAAEAAVQAQQDEISDEGQRYLRLGRTSGSCGRRSPAAKP